MSIKKLKKREVLGEVREEKLSSAKINEVIDVTNSITESAGVLKSKTVRLTSAMIQAHTGVNFEINVDGKIILPISAVWKYTHVTTPYAGTSNIQIEPVI